jgi:hypothetical protein
MRACDERRDRSRHGFGSSGASSDHRDWRRHSDRYIWADRRAPMNKRKFAHEELMERYSETAEELK